MQLNRFEARESQLWLERGIWKNRKKGRFVRSFFLSVADYRHMFAPVLDRSKKSLGMLL